MFKNRNFEQRKTQKGEKILIKTVANNQKTFYIALHSKSKEQDVIIMLLPLSTYFARVHMKFFVNLQFFIGWEYRKER